MVEVFHNIEFADFGLKLLNGEIPDIPKNLLRKVADVEAESLEAAFCLTNNIDNPWPENDGVTAVNNQFRSTSMGDVMVTNGITYIVAENGFKKVNLID